MAKKAQKKATNRKRKPATKARPASKTSSTSKTTSRKKKVSTAGKNTKTSARAQGARKRADTKPTAAASPKGGGRSSSKTTSTKASRAPVKKVVKKATAAKKAGKTTKASKTGKTTKAAGKAGKSATTTRQASKKAAKKATKKRGPVNLEEAPTEELWELYRKQAARRGAKEQEKLEALRNALMERHYPLVRYIAERLLQTLPKSIELDDLVSAGLFGLMDAIRGFDASRGIKFKTYCSTRIRGAILDQLRSQDWVPRLVRLKASRIERALQRLTAEYGREPTHAELARSLELDHQDLVKEIQESRARAMFSLSEKWEDDDGSVEKVEILEDKGSIDPVNELNRRDVMAFVTRALTHKERFIIEQYYQYGHTMREVGEMLALTESRVCQIHSNVMNRLKGLLGKKEGSLLS